jgi:hypothetical protein
MLHLEVVKRQKVTAELAVVVGAVRLGTCLISAFVRSRTLVERTYSICNAKPIWCQPSPRDRGPR